MNIGLDFDGVISHVGALKSSATRELFGKDVAPAKYDRDHVLANKILSHDEYENLKTFIYTSDAAEPHMVPVPGAIKHVKKLLSDGHDVKVITAREGAMIDLAKRWLAQYDVVLPMVGVGLENPKHLAAEGLDVFCDDSLIHLYEMRNAVPHRFLFDWEYNRKWDEKEYARRVYSWEELYASIRALESKR